MFGSLGFYIAWHQLNVDTGACYVSQYRRRRSPGTVEATSNTVKGLLDAKFIFESKYT